MVNSVTIHISVTDVDIRTRIPGRGEWSISRAVGAQNKVKMIGGRN